MVVLKKKKKKKYNINYCIKSWSTLISLAKTINDSIKSTTKMNLLNKSTNGKEKRLLKDMKNYR
jgi:hypothetical protein